MFIIKNKNERLIFDKKYIIMDKGLSIITIYGNTGEMTKTFLFKNVILLDYKKLIFYKYIFL